MGRRGVRRVRHRARRRARALDGPRFPPRMGPRPIRRRREEGRGDFDGGAADGVPPAGVTCGDFSARRTQVARDILTCNQDNWRENCLAHYSADVEYTDGPGLTRIRGAAQMGTYLANQFQFSRQYLTVSDETCAADTYVAEWSLDMDLGTGELRGMPGISVLRFVPSAEPAAGDGDEDENLVAYHRDYLPDGKIWENAPIVGPLVKFQRETYQSCMLSPKGCVDLLGAPK